MLNKKSNFMRTASFIFTGLAVLILIALFASLGQN